MTDSDILHLVCMSTRDSGTGQEERAMAEEKDVPAVEHRGPGRPKQEEFAGFEAIEDKKLRALVEKFADLDDERAEVRKKANDANAAIVVYMRANKIGKVCVGGRYVFVDPGKEKAVVREKAIGEDSASARRARKGADEE